MPVGEMLSRMSSYELTEWLAYYSLKADPPKPVQTPGQAKAILQSMMSRAPAAVHRRKKR